MKKLFIIACLAITCLTLLSVQVAFAEEGKKYSLQEWKSLKEEKSKTIMPKDLVKSDRLAIEGEFFNGCYANCGAQPPCVEYCTCSKDKAMNVLTVYEIYDVEERAAQGKPIPPEFLKTMQEVAEACLKQMGVQ